MGRNWVEKLKVKGAAWGIPNNVVTELEEFVESAEEMQAQAVSPNATPAIGNAECLTPKLPSVPCRITTLGVA